MLRFKTLGVVAILVALLSIGGVIGWAGQEQPQYGGTLIVPQSYSAHISMSPVRTRVDWAEDIQVIQQFMEGLVSMDHSLKIIPAIAVSWETSEDGRTYTFHLRKGVKFQKGYGEVTAEDFKYSFERLVDPKEEAPSAGLLRSVAGFDAYRKGDANHLSGVKIVDDYTLEITLSELDVFFVNHLAEMACSVVPEKAVEDLGKDWDRTPVGAGPFKIMQWVGKTITLEAFDDYYAGRPYLDKILWKTVLEAGTRRAAFEAQDLDVNILTATDYVDYQEDPVRKDYLLEVAELWTRGLYLNTEWGPLQDKRVRQAIAYAINAEELAEAYCRNKAFAATSYLPMALPAFDPEYKGYPYNPEKARALLKEAGYPDGFELEIIGAPNARSWGAPLGVAFKPYLEKVGIKVSVVPVESGTRTMRYNEGDFQAVATSAGGAASSLLYIARYRCSNTRAEGNVPAYCNPEFDELIDEAFQTVDPEERIELVREAEKIFMEDLPFWPFNYNKAVMAYQPWVHGLLATPVDISCQDYSKVWIDGSSPRKE